MSIIIIIILIEILLHPRLDIINHQDEKQILIWYGRREREYINLTELFKV